jgi:PAS domain S-box-containing protein
MPGNPNDKISDDSKSLPSAEFLLAAVVDSSDDAIVSKDLNGIVRSWNKAASELFGYTAEEMIGTSILRVIPDDLQYEEEDILSRIRSGMRIEHFETVRVRKNGERFVVSVTISPVRDGTGRVVGVSKIARDITDRKRTDDARFRLAALVDSAEDAIISKDLNGIITSWNEGARQMFGYTSEEMIGQPLLRLIPQELAYEEEEILKKLRAGERINHYETTRVNKSGDPIPVSVTISPIRNASGKVVGASKIARNISERIRLEKIVVQSEKLAATGRMAAAVAHEINNPLESIVNLVYLARQECIENKRAADYLLTAENELERLAHLARQTLGFYRDTGSPTELHIHDLIKTVLTVYNAKLMMSGISVDTDFSDLRKITVSQGEMTQVFSNIISNAMDAMRNGGTLKIIVRKDSALGQDGIQATIRDNGTGIEPGNLERIFEPFFTTKGNLGTGIGLWVAKEITERRGGRISVSSTTEIGKSGTTISIFLPFLHPSSSMTTSSMENLGPERE